VALAVPGVTLNDGTVYTIFAMGLAGGEPALAAVPSADAVSPTLLPETGGQSAGMNLALIAALAGALLIASGLRIRFALSKQKS